MHDQEFLVQQKEKLEALQQKLENELEHLTVKVGKGHVASFPDYGTAEDENAMEVAQHAIDVDIQAKIENDLVAVTRALAKISDGTYGKCDTAGCEIPIERLKAMPEAVVCAKHAV